MLRRDLRHVYKQMPRPEFEAVCDEVAKNAIDAEANEETKRAYVGSDQYVRGSDGDVQSLIPAGTRTGVGADNFMALNMLGAS